MPSRYTAWLVFFGGLIATLLVVLIVMVASDDSGAPAAGDTSATDPAATTFVAVSTTAASGTSASSGTTAASGGTAPSPTAAPATTAAAATVPPGPVNRCTGLDSMIRPADAVNAGGANGVFGGGAEPESIMDADFAFLFESGGAYYVGFSLSVGYFVFEQLPDPLDPAFVPELLVVNFDGSDDAAWVKIDHSLAAGADVYAFYFLNEDCGIEDAGTDGTPRYEFLDWSGAQHTQAFTCAGDGVIETLAGLSSTPGIWEVTNNFYEWTAPLLPGFFLAHQESQDFAEGDPAIAVAGVVDC